MKFLLLIPTAAVLVGLSSLISPSDGVETARAPIALCSSGLNKPVAERTKPLLIMNPTENHHYYRLEASAFAWEIAQGKTIEAWGYNNQVPGPTLKARQGDTLTIAVKNNLDEPTTIHWHGLRIPSQMDGTEEVQRAIYPGEEFVYEFVVPDAGTFWYHPHVNETVQMERGMYGAIVVTSSEDDPVMDDDRVFMIDDMKLNSKNQFATPSWFYPRWMERHNGREGETLLLSGKEAPQIRLAAGQYERWRFVNAASARYFKLHLGGKAFRIIGTDGGLLEQPVPATEVLITPGERMDLVVGGFSEGDSFAIESLPYNRGTGEGKRDIFGYVVVGERAPSLAELPESLKEIAPIAPFDAPVTKTIKLHGRRNWKDGVDFTINDQMHLHDTPVLVGDLQVWEISNPSMLDHPFHLHGFFFQVLEVNGTVPVHTSWKDTFSVPRGGKIKIAWIADNRPGKWMYHCHILEHAAAGMMAHFEVINPAQSTKVVQQAHLIRPH